MKRIFTLSQLSLTTLFSFFSLFIAFGQTDRYWSGGGTNENMNNTSNWYGGVNPSSNDNLYFNNTITQHYVFSNYGGGSFFNTIITYNGAGGIRWRGDRTYCYKYENNNDATAFEIEGSIDNRGGSDMELNPAGSGGINVLAASTVTIESGRLIKIFGGNTLTVNGIIAGGGGLALQTSNPTVDLKNTNTYTGTTTIAGGILKLNKTGGTTIPVTNNVTLTGGTLQVKSNQTLNNLIVNGGSVAVDDGVILTINGTLTLTSGKITLGTTGTGSVVVSATGSISGGSSASYVVTNGTGVGAGGLTQLTANTAKLFPVGATGSSYDPVTITPMTGVNFTVYVKSTLTNPIKSGTTANFAVQREWNITATGQGATTLAFTPHSSAVNAGNTPSGSAGVAGHWNGSSWDTNIATAYAAGTWTITGYTGTFSPFVVAAPGVVLAAELTSFKGSTAKGQNILDWSTASEKNAAHFDIQRSNDNTAWTSIGQVKAVNNVYGSDYQFIDAQPLSGTNYYRLQMVDANGATELSKIVAVNASTGNKSLKIYPNPAKDVLTILTDANTEGVSIFDINGRLVLSVVDKSQNVNIQNLASGVYFVRMMDKTGFVGSPIRFVKQ